MRYENLILRKDKGIATIILNRPNVLNALNGQLMDELYTAFQDAENDVRLGILILEGAGRSFSTGHDLKEILAMSLFKRREIFGKSVRIWEYMARMKKPIIAAVHGYASAAGCALAAASDLVIASEDALFQTPGVNIGLFCITPMVPISRSVGLKKAFEMLITGETFTAAEAERIGLVNKVVPKDTHEEEAVKMAEKIISKSWIAVQIGKPAFHTMFDMDYLKALEYARDLITLTSTTEDANEGIKAILEKRQPKWKNQSNH